MDSNKKPWPLATICGLKSRINTNPDFQRPAVWSSAQKRLLIDTILRGFDIPKLYWCKIATNPDRYDVVDGQQRLRAIWEFHMGDFSLPKDADLIDSFEVAGKKYDELPDDLRIKFDTYPLDIVIVTEAVEDEVREMFLRLQNGTTLKAQEKRNAMPGKMRTFVKGVAKHPFFLNCAFSNARYTFDHITAQMILIELNGGPCNVKNQHLNAMYLEQVDFDDTSQKARKVKRVLDYLLRIFPDKTPELERYSVISLYAMLSHLLEKYVMDSREGGLADWFIEFEGYRREQHELPEDVCDSEILVYHEKISHSTDAVDSISWRHEYLLRKYFEAVPDIELKDDQRLYAHEQRLAIFRRDGGLCKVRLKCSGVKCDWDSWEADHKISWSKGGKTIVQNGQVACLACNAAKSNK